MEGDPASSQVTGISNGLSVSASATDPCSATGNVAKVTCMVQTFKAGLNESQSAAFQLDMTKENATKWSGATGGLTQRNGVEFSSLSNSQQQAARAIISAAMGTGLNEGGDEFRQINLGDAYLGSIGGSLYGSGNYAIAVLGNPALEGTWMLQIGGHNYTQNIAFKDGVAVSGSPSFQGTEPRVWTFAGVEYAPMKEEHEAMTMLLASLSQAELTNARLATASTELRMGKGKEGEFPATRSGVKLSEASAATRNRFITGLYPWLDDYSYDLRTKLLNVYTNEMNETYISYSGNSTATSGNPGSFLIADGDYVRIDGPSVWIEFIVKKGNVFVNDYKYQSVYRDRSRDYNGL
ncbi:hypothetical protein D9M68_652950 [compost metagenome]